MSRTQILRASRLATLLLLLLAAASVPACRTSLTVGPPAVSGEVMSRTELFFGLSRSGQPDVSEAEFQSFLETEVTPRFPQGYTVLNAEGRWRDVDTGVTIKEPSRILVLIYSPSAESAHQIENIRTTYKNRFNQQAVLRTDDTHRGSF